jgi:aryl-alcohol dehydrogenase-like predicted oxidoreductase
MGLLTGKHNAGVAPNTRFALFEGFGSRYRKPNVDEAVAAYTLLARDHGLSPTHLALAFVRSRYFVASTILGATSVAQLDEDLDSLQLTLSPELLAKIL